MTLSSLCTSLPLSKRLKELNVKSNCLFLWSPNPFKETGHYIATQAEAARIAIGTGVTRDESYPAFTASELMELLPDTIGKGEDSAMLVVRKEASDLYCVAYEDWNDEEIASADDESLADALALLLIHLIENEIWKPENKN